MMVFRSFLWINPHNFVKNHPIFKNKGLFYAKLHRVLLEILFTLQISSLWSLGPKNQFCANWGQKTCEAISLELCLQFLQTRPHFICKNFRKYHQLGVWDLKTSLGPYDTQKTYQAIRQES